MLSKSIVNTAGRTNELKKNLPVQIYDSKDVVFFFDIDYYNIRRLREGRPANGG